MCATWSFAKHRKTCLINGGRYYGRFSIQKDFFLAVIYILLLFQFTFYSSSTITGFTDFAPSKVWCTCVSEFGRTFFHRETKKKIFVGHLEPCFHFMTWFLMPNFVSYFQQIRLYTCVVISPQTVAKWHFTSLFRLRVSFYADETFNSI